MRHAQRKKRQGRIPLDQIDIREVLDDLDIYYSESGKNVSDGWIGVSCPFCDDDSNHLGIHIRDKVVSCFKCGTTGNIIKYLSEELNSFSKAIQLLGDSVPRELKVFGNEIAQRAINVDLPKEAINKIPDVHYGYLQNRGFDPQKLTDKYNFQFCEFIGDWRSRIIVPIVHSYRLVTFTSIHVAKDSKLRYKHLPAEKSIIPIKHYLYGLEHTNKHSCVVVEGLFDMFRIGDGAVCVFGTKITPEQTRLLSKFNKVVIAFDGDDAGRVSGEKLANNLAPFCDVKLLSLPEGLDPDKLSSEDIEEVRNA